MVSSSPLVPRNDPTLMFTNAGMVQFKNVFTGLEQRPYSTAVTAQKCVRAGGKHNDLDNVGYTARHHTFFEMLGNFSFGDYFKEHAIELAWNLITREYRPRRQAPAGHRLSHRRRSLRPLEEDRRPFRRPHHPHPDQRQFLGHGRYRSLRSLLGNLLRPRRSRSGAGLLVLPDEDGDRFIEIWNLVFMQYEQITKEERVDLPRPSIDTGMGLERLAAVLQGQHDNYEIDLFRALIAASEEATGVKAEGDQRASHRVIADHLRSSAFLIADGVLPSNEGRGYVLRRIMRRAMRHAQLLGARDPLMWKLLPALVGQMGRAYPELMRAEALISETLKLEETRFRKTLERGLEPPVRSLGRPFRRRSVQRRNRLQALRHLRLPARPDRRMRCAPSGISVDTDAFTDRHGAAEGRGPRQLGRLRRQRQPKPSGTSSREKHGATEFLGYDTEVAEGVRPGDRARWRCRSSRPPRVKPSRSSSTRRRSTANRVARWAIRATITTDGGKLVVTDTQKRGEGLFVHFGVVAEGTIKTGDAAQLEVDHARRSRLRANHSATHLLHEALREVLGTHVAQKGSLVAPERLRFDVSHPKPMTAEELKIVEEMANEIIVQNTPVTTRLMSVDDAIAEGAMALFGEKYGDEVRVVSMGQGIHGSKANRAYSVELCGGTHVSATGDIGLVRVVSESAVGAGVRRVEALTGEAARAYLNEQDERVKTLANTLKVQPGDVLGRVEALLDERRKLERELTEAKKKLALGGGGQAGSTDAARDIAGMRFLGKVVSGVEPKDLKSLADDGKKSLGSGVVAFVGVSGDGKASAVVAVTDDLTSKVSAVDLVRIASAALGGKGGGGRPDMAQAGGPDGEKAADAIEAVAVALAG